MPALHTTKLPSNLASAIGLFRHSRPGLSAPALMPRVERAVSNAQVDSAWLAAYRACVGLPEDTFGLPPLALQIAAAPLHLSILADAKFPFRALGLVHLSQQIEQTHVVLPSANVDLMAYTTDARWEKRGMSFGLVTEARVDGELIWTATTRALALGKSPGGLVPAGLGDALGAATAPRIDELLEVEENFGRRYAKIAGDLNPIHQHALLARPFGFKRAIVHGTWTLARALAVAGLPRQLHYRFDASFRRPVELPSQIRISAFGEIDASRYRVLVQSADRATTHLRVNFEEFAL